jgi:hypothetical protein
MSRGGNKKGAAPKAAPPLICLSYQLPRTQGVTVVGDPVLAVLVLSVTSLAVTV